MNLQRRLLKGRVSFPHCICYWLRSVYRHKIENKTFIFLSMLMINGMVVSHLHYTDMSAINITKNIQKIK